MVWIRIDIVRGEALRVRLETPRARVEASAAGAVSIGRARSSLPVSEVIGTVLRDRDDVLEPHAEFTGQIDARLVRQGHPGREQHLAAAVEVGILMTFETDAMSEPMRERAITGTV